MIENSYEWFEAEFKKTSEQIKEWPSWLLKTSDVATASFPVPQSKSLKKKSEFPSVVIE